MRRTEKFFQNKLESIRESKKCRNADNYLCHMNFVFARLTYIISLTESTRKIYETALSGVKCKASPFNTRDAQNNMSAAIGVFPELKYAIDIQQCGTVDYDNTPRREIHLPPYENYNRSPFYQQDFFSWPAFPPEFQKYEQNPWASLDNRFYPVPQGYPYLPFRTYLPGYPQGLNAQEFQYFVVVDFEATCDKEKNPHPQEIIEFPSVLVNSMTGQLEASFQTYVRPAYNQSLTDFCKELTGIQQIQVQFFSHFLTQHKG